MENKKNNPKKSTFYVTTPIYYSSGAVHIGNSYTTIACDTIARFERLKGIDTLFLTGMDEHGQKIEEAAKALNREPQDHVNIIASDTKTLWDELQISYDDFIQTSELRHTKVVQGIFEKLLKTGDIYLGKYTGDYCVFDEAFFTKTQLNEDGTCPDCGRPTTKVEEECYFLKLKEYQNKLLDFIKNNEDFIQPTTRRNEVVSFLESGLEDLAISRTTFKWGIPVLSNPRHVVYVWIDALSNYISALGYSTDDDNKYQKYWINGDEVVHVIGKDILRFHAIYWPIMLMALDIPIKFKLYVHGWVLMKEGKMSKSKGNVVYPRDVISRYGLDALRYYLVREMPLGNDCVFTYERFIETYNVDLANDYGNLVSRTVSMINKYFKGLVSKSVVPNRSFEDELESTIIKVTNSYQEYFSNFRLQNGLNEVWSLIGRTNKYIDETAPWVLAKDENNQEILNSVMYHLYESLRIITTMISPVMPDAAKVVFEDLGINEQNIDDLVFGKTLEAKVSEKNRILFKRLDVEEEIKYHESLEVKKPKTKAIKPEITINDFNKLDIRVGEIVACEKDINSDKLLILKIKIEDKVRQIVSSIAESYDPIELVGKHIAVLVNLKPIKIRGHQSEGMILCANGDDKHFEVLELFKHDSYSEVN